MKRENKSNYYNFFLGLLLLFLIIISVVIGLKIRNDSLVVDEKINLQVADNNCCSMPNCDNYGGDWSAGYYACEAGECAQCEGGATGCNNNDACDAGELDTNCPNDCDSRGFSEYKVEGHTCNPAQNDQGEDQCDLDLGLTCVTCPTNAPINAGAGRCSTHYSTSDTYIEQFYDVYCVPEPLCGNGDVESGEECDDGNQVDTDTCDNHCNIVVTPNMVSCTRCTASMQDGNSCDYTEVADGETCPSGYFEGTSCAANQTTGSCPVDLDLPQTAISFDESTLILMFGIFCFILGISLTLPSLGSRATE